MERSRPRTRLERAAIVGVVGCGLGVALVVAAGCGGSSGTAVLAGSEVGTEAAPTADVVAPDASPVEDASVVTDGAPALDGSDGAVPTPKRVFFTYHVYAISAFNGLAGADTLCQSAATSIGLGAQFRAWLSSEVDTASARLTHSAGPYVTLNNVLVAASWAELTSGSLRHAIDQTEMGPVPQTGSACGFGAVWTGTLTNGSTDPGATCDGWSTTSGNATLGYSIGKNNSWTSACSGVCAGTASLYCIEQ